MKIISLLSTFILLLNTILYFKRFTSNGRSFKVFTVYLSYILFFQIASTIMSRLHIHNLYLTHYYFIGQFIFLSYFYANILNSEKFKLAIKIILAIILFVLGIQFIVDPEIYFTFSLLEIILTFIPIVIYTLFYFYESFGIESKGYLTLNSGIYFYLLSSTLIFSAGNLTVFSNSPIRNLTWTINSYLFLIYQLSILFEWYKNFKKTSNKTEK